MAGSFSNQLQKLDRNIQKAIEQRRAVGCAVGVVHNDKVIFLKAYGVRKKGQHEPVNLDTVFQLGSISKPITSTLVAILQKEGHLQLDDSMESTHRFLDPSTKLRHILSHTTGFKRAGWNAKIENNVPRKKLIEDLSRTPQKEPGTGYDYHNFIYSLTEDFLEKSRGVSFADLLNEKLFKPLGMLHASVGIASFMKQDNKTWPHQINAKDSIYPSRHYSRFYHMIVPSAGGMNASIRDVVAFLRCQMNGQKGIIERQDLDEFHKPATEAGDAKNWFSEVIKGPTKSFYGLGWRLLETTFGRVVFHGGYVKGFKNFLAFSPQHNIGIVILHNCENGFAPRAAMKFLMECCNDEQ